MKGDFSRSTFDRERPFSGVRQQQGRVFVDADWNEAMDIQDHLRESALRDVVGPSGVPADERRSFAVEPGSKGLTVRRGRIWVDGMLCRLDRDLSLEPSENGRYLVYLEAWERHLSAVEEPSIREKALGGPDTASRTRTTCKVRLEKIGAGDRCASFWEPPAPTGEMTAWVSSPTIEDDPCEVPSQAGYTGLENHLYRVEVHHGGETSDASEDQGTEPKPTVKWSRDNGSVVTELLTLSADTKDPANKTVLKVRSLGRDKVSDFHDARWVELSHDGLDEEGRPGHLVNVVDIATGADGYGLLTVLVKASDLFDPSKVGHPKVRRWDSGAIEIDAGMELKLEHHITTLFSGGTFRSGDWWWIPARTYAADVHGAIEWPQVEGQADSIAPHGIRRRFAKLAIVDWQNNDPSIIEDCRRCFAPLAGARLAKVVGDGQQARPGSALPCPLIVRVESGGCPVRLAHIRFKVDKEAGSLFPVDGISGRQPTGSDSLDVKTDHEGLARCTWRLPRVVTASTSCLRATASLLASDGKKVRASVVFSADVLTAAGVAYTPGAGCTDLPGVDTVQEALDELCKRRLRDPGIGLLGVDSVLDSAPLLNDSEVRVNRLVKGIRFRCDQKIDDSLFRPPEQAVSAKPLVSLTLELPFQSGVGTIPLRLGGSFSADGKDLVWWPGSTVSNWLQDLHLIQEMPDALFLLHLEARGNFIWRVDANDKPMYLDGDSFGVADGNRIALKWPTGDGIAGGDFRMWIWLAGDQRGPRLTAVAVQGNVIQGELVDESGTVMPGANILLLAPGRIEPPRSTTTLSNGSFKFRGVTPGLLYTVRADLAGFDPIEVQVFVPDRNIVVDRSRDFPILEIENIGDRRATVLENIGINTASHLARLQPRQLAAILRVSETQAKKMIDHANEGTRE